ncbi:hypothetical protein M1K46_07960 [Fictibacillus sp. WQ 8-8]|uniref:hypothetical protein n=1 Tax=Fictibacillus sp. WQ 8-8 TaxID=2938788 RepID=UPI00210A47D7|nr:hypothetical protein [Fictibacillus sp. WQ 8-8]MCQ6265597.1 hypothetical protein [Fictibacillus sp. WQ 8-8]
MKKSKREKVGMLTKEEREKKKRLEELKAMNNIINDPVENERIRNKFNSKAQPTVGNSKENKKWDKIRKERYNQSVWKEWRVKDDKPSPVVTYNIYDIKE